MLDLEMLVSTVVIVSILLDYLLAITVFQQAHYQAKGHNKRETKTDDVLSVIHFLYPLSVFSVLF
jgi:hypothetical protein